MRARQPRVLARAAKLASKALPEAEGVVPHGADPLGELCALAQRAMDVVGEDRAQFSSHYSQYSNWANEDEVRPPPSPAAYRASLLN